MQWGNWATLVATTSTERAAEEEAEYYKCITCWMLTYLLLLVGGMKGPVQKVHSLFLPLLWETQWPMQLPAAPTLHFLFRHSLIELHKRLAIFQSLELEKRLQVWGLTLSVVSHSQNGPLVVTQRRKSCLCNWNNEFVITLGINDETSLHVEDARWPRKEKVKSPGQWKSSSRLPFDWTKKEKKREKRTR